MGVVCYPFLATPYPGSEWFTVYKDKILEQYGGDLEAYISDLDDATKITANICENFSTVELLGIRELMVTFNWKKLEQFEEEWWSRHETTRIPKFVSSGWRARAEEAKQGQKLDAFAYELKELTRPEYEQLVEETGSSAKHKTAAE